MASSQQVMRADFSRVFIIENRAGPDHAPTYQALAAAGTSTWDQGKVTPTFAPDPDNYGQFILIDKVPGEPGLPEITVDANFTVDQLSSFLKLVARQCNHDVQLHFGVCKNPRDFDRGWSKSLILENAVAASHSTTALGALEPNKRAVVTETVKFDGVTMYEIKPLSFAEKAGAQVNDEVMSITFCDKPTCGTCGIASDGCQVIFAVTKSSGGSPGLVASIVFSTDGGRTWSTDAIDSLAANSAPNDVVCIGPWVFVLSAAAEALEYAGTADIIAGTETWAQIGTGFVAGKGPTRAYVPSSTFCYFVGLGGYIYTSSDPTSGVTVLDPGTVSVQDYTDIRGVDIETFMAVGKNNTVVYTLNGGQTFASVTGPAPGVDLNTCFMRTATEWLVGGNNGRLYYTRDAGTTWFEKTFPGGGSGHIRDIEFATDSIGYMTHDTTTPRGRMLRTINGGFSWYVLPEDAGTVPNNQRLNEIAVCADPNVVMSGGLSSGGTDGIIVAGA